MLVLTRKLNEEIAILTTVEALEKLLAELRTQTDNPKKLLRLGKLQVCQISGPRIRIGIEAPEAFEIVREEVLTDGQRAAPKVH